MRFFDIFKSKKKREEAEKFKSSLGKTRKSPSFLRLKQLFADFSEVNNDFFDELEEIFIMADIGVDTVIKFVDELRSDEAVQKMDSPKELQSIIIDKMFDIYLKGQIVNSNLIEDKNNLNVYLFVGVNGVGKTTTIAKVAYKLIKEGKKVCLAAGDTFRAGAIQQLKIWGERAGSPVISKPEGSDPSSVIYDAIQYAKDNNYDCLLCDTAGRLQTKVNLMKELEKIKKVISREVPNAPQDTLLVIDATTGQNGLNQAKAFIEATDVTGVVLTKLDGTAKGGIVLAIRDVYDIPIKFVGTGEKIEDIEYFDLEQYIYGLFAELIDEED